MNDITNPTRVYPSNLLSDGSNQRSVSFQDGWNYESAVKEVEAIIARIESGELELADVFDQFTAAVERLQQCETFLVERQQQMDLLIETLNDEPGF